MNSRKINKMDKKLFLLLIVLGVLSGCSSSSSKIINSTINKISLIEDSKEVLKIEEAPAIEKVESRAPTPNPYNIPTITATTGSATNLSNDRVVITGGILGGSFSGVPKGYLIYVQFEVGETTSYEMNPTETRVFTGNGTLAEDFTYIGSFDTGQFLVNKTYHYRIRVDLYGSDTGNGTGPGMPGCIIYGSDRTFISK